MSTQQKPTELLNEQLSSENEITNKENSNSELVYEKQYGTTGLYVRGNPNDKYFITAGVWLIAKGYETPGDAEKALDNRDWNVIMGIVDAMIQHDQMSPYSNINDHNPNDTEIVVVQQ